MTRDRALGIPTAPLTTVTPRHVEGPVRSGTRILSTAHAVARRAILAPYVAGALARVTGVQAAVFMLHRFNDPERGISGTHDAEVLRKGLTLLRKEGFEFLAVDELVRRLRGDGPPPVRGVAFTIDDGYLDQATIAAPLFAQFDCPVTTFLTTDFLDGARWMWWDRVEFVFRRTNVHSITTVCGGVAVRYDLKAPGDRQAAQADFTRRCKQVAEQDKDTALAQLGERAEVEVPSVPPREYAPMTWADARRCEELGMTFGAHTRSHPVLARTTEEQARAEITGSRARLREELRRPIDVFCYPNGGQADFGPREVAIVQSAGFRAAVTSQPAYLRFDSGASPDSMFRIPRFGYPTALSHVIRCAAGLAGRPVGRSPS